MKKIFAFTTFIIGVLFLLVSCGTSIKGTYYSWNSYKYELDKSYSITFESKGQWYDSDGFSGTYEVDGSNITIYVTIMGFTEKMCDGTIGDGKFEYKIYETHTYYKEGYEPKKADEVTKTEDSKTEESTNKTEESTNKTEESTDKTQEVEYCTVKFDSDGGSAVDSVKVEKNKQVKEPTSPTKEGYVFVGWYYGNSEWDFTKAVTSNITLKAKWEIEGYSIYFDYNGHGTGPEFISGHTEIPEDLPIPSASGCVFLGWYMDADLSNPVEIGTEITRDITIEAKWHILNEGESSGLDIQDGKLIGIGTCTDSEIVIPNLVTEIGSDAFAGCTNITNITIPSTVTIIGNTAFKNCTSLEELYIPTSVTSIGAGILANCISLKSLTIPFVGTTNNSQFGSLFASGYDYSVPKGTYRAMFYTSNAYYYIPLSLTSVNVLAGEISEGAFANCKGLTKIVLPETLTNINKATFKNCEGLTEIIIPDTVLSIDEQAFTDCDNLSTVYNASDLVFVVGSKDYGKIAYYATNVYNKGEWECVDGVPTPITE